MRYGVSLVRPISDYVLPLSSPYIGLIYTTFYWLQYVTYNGAKSKRETIKCGVPQGSILGPLLFLLYINDLSTVSNDCFSVLFADDTNMFVTGKNTSEMCVKLNNDLGEICEWLRCNKLSLNILKTHYMIFTTKNKTAQDLDIKISNTAVERVYDTKFLGVYIDAQLTWKRHIEYTCSKLSKCAGILLKARKKLNKSALISLYYSFAYPYFIYCNQVWGNTYPTNLGRMVLLQKRLVRVVTCSHYRAHTEPLMLANQLLSINDINVYVVGIFMYNYVTQKLPQIFENYFQRNRDVHGLNTRQANDFYVPFSRLQIRRFSIKIHGSEVWNSFPTFIKIPTSLMNFKKNLRKYLIDKNLLVTVSPFWCYMHIFDITV